MMLRRPGLGGVSSRCRAGAWRRPRRSLQCCRLVGSPCCCTAAPVATKKGWSRRVEKNRDPAYTYRWPCAAIWAGIGKCKKDRRAFPSVLQSLALVGFADSNKIHTKNITVYPHHHPHARIVHLSIVVGTREPAKSRPLKPHKPQLCSSSLPLSLSSIQSI